MRGKGISGGIGLGVAFIHKEDRIDFSKENISDIDKELERLNTSIEIAKEAINRIYQKTLDNYGEKESDIFIAHRMFLEDPEYIGAIKEKIKLEKVNAEWSLMEITNLYIAMFDKMKDPYIKERVIDLEDVSNRLLKILLNIESKEYSKLDHKIIIIAKDLKPSDMAQMDYSTVVGIVTEDGGKTSHTGIMARAMNIPSVSGIKNLYDKVEDGDFIIIEGNTGAIIINPSQDEINFYRDKKQRIDEEVRSLKNMIGKESLSKDGYKISIHCNIASPNDMDDLIKNDGEGVGLYRTEFLYMNRDRLPTEDDQFNAYKIVAEKLKGKPLVIRTLDVGGDKDVPYLNLPKEINPFLGYRAIRYCLGNRQIFKSQLRAILRASAYGDIRIMFPMISSLEELRLSKAILQEVKKDLRAEKIDFNEEIKVGIMVEVPSVAIQSRAFAKEVDFFSIGTNDLIQYTLAVDRVNQDVSYLYNQYNPAVLSLIKTTIDNGHKEGIKVGMCGESAGDMKLIPVFLAMGLDELSMSPSSVLKARYLIRNTNKEEIEDIMDEILALGTAREVEEFLDDKMS